MQTSSLDSLCFTYYVTDIEGNVKDTYSKNAVVVVHLDVQNNSQDTLWALANHYGVCYNCEGHLQESLSYSIVEDTVPVYSMAIPNGDASCSVAYILSVPSGWYHYQNPSIMFYYSSTGRQTSFGENEQETEYDVHYYTIPLTIGFEVK